MKRMLLLVTVGLMLAAAMALSGVTQAAPISDKADAQCAKLAIRTLGPSANPSNYTFHGGTEGNDLDDTFKPPTEGPAVFCGFGGDDQKARLMDVGDIFLGGPGDDSVSFNYGTFNGGEGIDSVVFNEVTGTFNGEAGNDSVTVNEGTFNGGEGIDSVTTNLGGTISSVEQGDV
jgi:hypothetical protein